MLRDDRGNVTARGRGRRKEGRWRIGREGGGEGEEEGGGWKVMFWNVAGLKNKVRSFWEGLEGWDVVMISETWVGERDWEKIKGRLPGGFKWGAQWASRKSKRGRNMGGMLMGIRKTIMEKGTKIEREEEGMIVGRVRQGKERWRKVGVYVSEGIERALQVLEKWTDIGEEGVKTLIGGDFNARTGREGGRVEMEEEGREREGEGKRRSKDGKMNKEGKRLVKFLEEIG